MGQPPINNIAYILRHFLVFGVFGDGGVSDAADPCGGSGKVGGGVG